MNTDEHGSAQQQEAVHEIGKDGILTFTPRAD
jgi:hypothetical protein